MDEIRTFLKKIRNKKRNASRVFSRALRGAYGDNTAPHRSRSGGRHSDSGGDGAVELFARPARAEMIARALLAPLFNYKSLSDFFSKKVRAKVTTSPPILNFCVFHILYVLKV